MDARPAARLSFPADAGHLLDPCLEPLIAQRLALIDSAPDIVNRRVIELGTEWRALGGLPLLVIPPQRDVQRMRRQSRIELFQPIGAVARPAIVRGVFRHGRTHGVQFNIPLTGEQVAFGVYQ
jgi:hypothetical protein